MTEESADRVIIAINHKLNSLSSARSKPSIFRVGSHFQSSGRSGGWDDVYDPRILAVGPYHHGIPRLQDMEQVKVRYLKRLLERRNEQSAERYVNAVAAMEKLARKCYAEPLNVDEAAFVTLMVFDGLFLVELFRYYAFKNLRHADDRIFSYERIRNQLRHDILLLENQLPFFVLNELFIMTKTTEDSDESLISLALRFFDGVFIDFTALQARGRLSDKCIEHLCGLIHDAWCLPFAEAISQGYFSKSDDEIEIWDNIDSVAGLQEAGINFIKTEGNNLLDIKFVNGVLRIPQLSIFNETELQLRNLMAYEQYLPNRERRYISDYAFFMHCLINNSNDVGLLCRCGIIRNYLGTDEEICLMFNRLGRNILISSNFCYSQVFCSVNKHCRSPVKKWKANLQRKYFNRPWSILLFVAAVAFLLLTLIQTTFKALIYYKRNG